MNTNTLVREHQTASQSTVTTHRVNRPNAIDRVALQLGLFLIMWGRRPRPALERRATKREHLLLQREQERMHERLLEQRINQRWL
jgi:hypothetical protein